MKKFYSLLVVGCLMLLQGVAFAQNGSRLMKSPVQVDVKQVQSRSAESSVELGYCDDGIVGGLGIGRTYSLSGAIYITPEQAKLYENDQIESISIGLSSNVTKCSVFIVKELGGTKLAEQNVGNASFGWKDVKLNNPYTITGEGFYVGYTCTGDGQIGLSNTQSENSVFVELDGKWDDNADQFPALCIRANVAGDNMPNDFNLINVEDCISKVGESFILSGVVKSMTTIPVTNYEIKYAIGDGAYASQTIEKALSANMLDSFRIEVPAITEIGEYTLHVAVSKINGNPDDYEGNSTKECIVRCKEYVFPYKIVVEEGTGTWCGWCPRGIVGMREMKKKYPDSFIGIAVHADDPMKTSSYTALLSNLKGYPGCIVNRNKDLVFDPAFANLEKAYLDEIKKGADVGITVAAQFASEDQKVVEISTQTVFGYSMENAAFRIAFVVLENGVTGYKQTNNYAGGRNGEMGGFESLSGSAKIDFDDVARGIYKSYNGTLSSVPTTVVKGETYAYSYELTLPTTIQNKNNLEIVALLINSTTKEIVNADKVELKAEATGIDQVQEHSSINVYAEDGEIKVSGDYDTLQVYTTEGVEILNSQLNSGVYLVRIVAGNHIYVKKIAL